MVDMLCHFLSGVAQRGDFLVFCLAEGSSIPSCTCVLFVWLAY